MTTNTRTRRQTGAALFTTAVAGVGLLTGGVSSAAAAPPAATCEATALQLALLGSIDIAASHAGSASAPCSYDNGVLDLTALGLVSAKTVDATTRVANGSAGSATATSTIENLAVGSSALTSQLTTGLLGGTGDLSGELESTLAPLLGPGGAVTSLLAPLQGLGLGVVGLDGDALLGSAAGDLPGALAGVLPNIATAGLIQAQSVATCIDGRAALSGSTRLAGVSVLGTTIDPDSAVSRTISLDTAALSVADLVSVNDVLRSITVNVPSSSVLGLVVGGGQRSLYDLLTIQSGGVLGLVNGLLPVGTTLDSLLTSLSASLEPVIQQTELPLPTGLLRAVVTPESHTVEGSGRTDTALALSVTALGQPVLSGALAQARVTTGAVNCADTPTPVPSPTPTGTPVPSPTPNPPVVKQGDPTDPANDQSRFSSGFAERALQCESVRLRLLDVRRSGSKTYVQGVAERSYVGATATIYSLATKKRVGRAVVASNGVFSTKVSLPAKKIRGTSKARYYAVVSGDRTKSLKFTRRMFTTSLSETGGTITFRGRTTSPRAASQRPVEIQERVSCSVYRTVAKVKPTALGTFSASFAAPSGAGSGVYRAYTKVPSTAPSRKLKPTYTLPRVLRFSR